MDVNLFVSSQIQTTADSVQTDTVSQLIPEEDPTTAASLEEEIRFITFGDHLGEKPEGCYRLVFENFNSLSATTPKGPKITKLRKLLYNVGADALLGVEVGIHGGLATREERMQERFRSDRPLRMASGYNEHESLGPHQPGGTCSLAFDHLATTVTDTGNDESGLGRWSWVKVEGKAGHVTRIISAYRPCRNGNARSLQTVYAQQRRHWLSQHRHISPIKAFRDDLLAALQAWRETGERLILGIDANEDMATGILARALRRPDLRMRDLIRERTGLPGPATHIRGKKQIDGVWATPDITAEEARFLPFGIGVGDHRMLVVDIPSGDLIGVHRLRIARPQARRLQTKFSQSVEKYNVYLTKHLK